jgi:hypothetical protein
MAQPTVTSLTFLTPDGGRYPGVRSGAVFVTDALQVEFDRTDAKSTACRLDGPSPMPARFEHTAPLAALGDKPFAVKPGTYTLTLTPYSEPMGKGKQGPDYVVRFEVRAPVRVGTPPAPAPNTGAGEVATLKARVAELERQLAEPWSFEVAAPPGYVVNSPKVTFTRTPK